MLTIRAFFCLQFELSFAYNGKVCLRSTSTDCKQRSPTVSKKRSKYYNRPVPLQSPGTPKPQKCILKSEKCHFGPSGKNGIFRTLKCTFGVSGFRGSVGGLGDCNPSKKAPPFRKQLRNRTSQNITSPSHLSSLGREHVARSFRARVPRRRMSRPFELRRSQKPILSIRFLHH